MCGKQGLKQRYFVFSQQGKAAKCAHGQSHDQAPIQQQSTSGSAQHTRSKAAGIAPVPASRRSSEYKTASESVVMRLNMPRWKRLRFTTATMFTIAPRGRRWRQWKNGLTETVKHQVFKSAGSHNVSPVFSLRSVAAAGTRATTVAWITQRHLIRGCLGLTAW